MIDRRTRLGWIRDLLEHMLDCSRHLEWQGDADTDGELTELLLNELNQCRRLCESLRGDGAAAVMS